MTNLSIIRNYYVKGEKHVCRFCGTPIRRLFKDVLAPLGNFAIGYMKLTNGMIYAFNGCIDCIRRLDASKQDVLDQIYDTDHLKSPMPAPDVRPMVVAPQFEARR